MRRRYRYALIAALLLAMQWSGPSGRPVLGDRADIKVTPTILDPASPKNVKVGALTFLGGAILTSRDPAFGGFSSLIVRGDDFTMLSDGGTIARFRMGSDWRITAAGFGDLPAGPGNAQYKANRDSESMTRDPATGQTWVGFEHTNQLWRYSHGFGLPAKGVAPLYMHDWSDNGGAESMVRLRDGRFLVIAETDRRPHSGGARNTLIFYGDPVEQPERGFRFGYIPPEGFDPSDATQLPDGRILVLNRQLQVGIGRPLCWSAVLTLIDPKDFAPGRIIRGREVARLAPPLNTDNFEGLAMTREKGATILWMVSDDNLFFLQRTLLMKFRLEL